MYDLDETDAEILRLLAADARRPFSDIAETVDLSPPAVSDRVSKLREVGVVRRFTVDVDRSQLHDGLGVLLRFRPGDDRLGDLRSALRERDAVEHLFTTADGDLVAFARVPDEAVHEWVRDAVDPDALGDYDVELVADAEWTPSVGAAGFALECAECGNTVTSEGTATRIDGSAYHFCCPSCEARFTERYDRIAEDA